MNSVSIPLDSYPGSISLEDLKRDPYPVYSMLRHIAPVAWIPALNMWYVTRYSDVRSVLLDDERFTTAWEQSTIFETFGAHMLTTDGAEHKRHRRPFQSAFMLPNIRSSLEAGMTRAAGDLVAGFKEAGSAELRRAFASRLPIQTIIFAFGLSPAAEAAMRGWYDSFEQALANFTGDPAIRDRARDNVAELHSYLQAAIDECRRGRGQDTLLSKVVAAADREGFDDGEIKRNLSIVLFGGISTVEALILNSLFALFRNDGVLQRVKSDIELLPKVLDETMRWMAPVQSATRHATCDTEIAGVAIKRGDVVNCMLGSANRDPSVFAAPDLFDIERPNIGAHLGFAPGPHMCLGFRLARLEAQIGLAALISSLTDLRMVPELSSDPEGYEFRQPRALYVTWRC